MQTLSHPDEWPSPCSYRGPLADGIAVPHTTVNTTAVTPFLPELTVDGLVLWRLRRETHQQLWCSVSDFAGEFALTVNNLGTGQVLVAEAHPEIVPLMNRAWGLRDQFVSAGWEEVDVDLDEPD